MCNYENGDAGFCHGCDSLNTAQECEEASFANSQTKDCLDKCVPHGKYTNPNLNSACVHFIIDHLEIMYRT